MRTLYNHFKKLTGKRGADLAESNNFTRQYISLLVNNPNANNNRRLARMMLDEIQKSIIQKTDEINQLKELMFKISHKGFSKEEAS